MIWDAVLIAGPTASGKSALALALAERLGGIVVNADSMQVYGELRILTARPSRADEARAPHRLYGHVPVRERYSAGRFARDARAVLADAQGASAPAIVVGGTGLYFNALTEGLSPVPAVPAAVRDKVAARHAAIGGAAFYAELAQADPGGVARLQAGDTQRVLRAAAVLAATGVPLSEWQREAGEASLAGLKVARFVLAPPRAVLTDRIDARFATMVETGALEEAHALAGLDPGLPAAKALGLAALQAHLRGERTLEDAVAVGQTATRRYAKRQMTWLRRFMRDWIWLEDIDLRNIITTVTSRLA